VIASVLRLLVPGATATPPTGAALIPDAAVIPAYLCIGFAFAGMLRRRRAAEDDPAQVDALLVGLAAAFMTWTFVISPSMDLADLAPLRVADAFFPVIDVVLLVLVAQLMLAGGARQPALWMLILAASAMFVADTLFTLRDGMLAAVSQHTLDSLFMLMFTLFAAAPLMPSMRTLTEPQQIMVRDLSRIRILVIASMMVAPIVVTSLIPLDSRLNEAVRTVLCVLLILAVLARVVGSNNSQARAERVNRRRATHDALTDLPNREFLAETVTRWATGPSTTTRRSACSSSTWTGSRWSTTTGATRSATSCSAPSRAGWPPRCAPRTWSAGSAATSS